MLRTKSLVISGAILMTVVGVSTFAFHNNSLKSADRAPNNTLQQPTNEVVNDKTTITTPPVSESVGVNPESSAQVQINAPDYCSQSVDKDESEDEDEASNNVDVSVNCNTTSTDNSSSSSVNVSTNSTQTVRSGNVSAGGTSGSASASSTTKVDINLQ